MGKRPGEGRFPMRTLSLLHASIQVVEVRDPMLGRSPPDPRQSRLQFAARIAQS